MPKFLYKPNSLRNKFDQFKLSRFFFGTKSLKKQIQCCYKISRCIQIPKPYHIQAYFRINKELKNRKDMLDNDFNFPCCRLYNGTYLINKYVVLIMFFLILKEKILHGQSSNKMLPD